MLAHFGPECSDCGVTTIVEYTLNNDKVGAILKGKCKKCGKKLVSDACVKCRRFLYNQTG